MYSFLENAFAIILKNWKKREKLNKQHNATFVEKVEDSPINHEEIFLNPALTSLTKEQNLKIYST